MAEEALSLTGGIGERKMSFSQRNGGEGALLVAVPLAATHGSVPPTWPAAFLCARTAAANTSPITS